jgi:exodeoxyribonuclease V beta subunit
VALTRGVYATWLGLAPLRAGNGKSAITDLHQTAIGYLLQQGVEGESEAMKQALDQLAASVPAVTVGAPPLQRPEDPYIESTDEPGEPQVRQFAGQIERDWWVSSYSALATSHGGGHERGVLATPGFDADAAGEQGSAPENERTIFTFPRGARPGTLLHTLFEELAFADVLNPACDEPVTQRIATLLGQAGFETEWAALLAGHMRGVLTTELLPGLRLGDVSRMQAELEFFLPMERISAASLDALRHQYDPLSRQARPLSFQRVQGMLKGFIDLVFEWQGRWYVLDYKSNWLGASAADYQGAALEQAMVDHHYDLQYQLYTLALHRLLAQRLPDYDPARHLGGIFYLFLRGMPQAGVYHCCPDAGFVAALDHLFAKGETR